MVNIHQFHEEHSQHRRNTRDLLQSFHLHYSELQNIHKINWREKKCSAQVLENTFCRFLLGGCHFYLEKEIPPHRGRELRESRTQKEEPSQEEHNHFQSCT